KKNASSRPVSTRTCHSAITNTKKPICRLGISAQWRSRRRTAAAAAGARSGAASGLTFLSFILPPYLVAQIVPDAPVEAVEARVEPDLGDVARPLERHLVDALDPRRPGRKHDDLVGER